LIGATNFMETYTITIHESIKLQQRYCFINDNIVTTVHTVKWTIIHFPEKVKVFCCKWEENDKGTYHPGTNKYIVWRPYSHYTSS